MKSVHCIHYVISQYLAAEPVDNSNHKCSMTGNRRISNVRTPYLIRTLYLAFAHFKDIIIQRIDMRARKLDILSYKPIRDEFCELLDILQRKLDEEKERQRIETATFRKLSKFSKDDITKYLDYLNEEAK